MTKFRIVLIILVGLMLYLNVGWHLGGYYNAHVLYTSEYDSFMAEALAGWGGFIGNGSNPPIENPHSGDRLQTDQRTLSILWPVFLLLAIGSWIVCGVTIFFGWIGALIGFFVWLIFQGGFGETVSNEATIPLGIVLGLFFWMLSAVARTACAQKAESIFGSISLCALVMTALAMIFS